MSDEDKFKICPFCKEPIKAEALKCRYCGEWLDAPSKPAPAPPTSLPALEQPRDGKDTDADVLRLEKEEEEPEKEPEKEVTPTRNPGEPAAWANQGVLWWNIVFLCTLLDTQYWKPWWAGITGIAMVFALSIWWCLRSKHICRRGLAARLSSYVLYALASIWLFVLPKTIIPIAERRGVPVGLLLSGVGIYGLVLFGMFLAAHHLQFRGAAFLGNKRRDAVSAGVVVAALLALLLWILLRPRLDQSRSLTNHGAAEAAAATAWAPFANWEMMKRDTNLVDAKSTFTPATKKRLRENFALTLMGMRTPQSNLSVELRGENNDILVFASSEMNAKRAAEYAQVLQQDDGEFWNEVRFVDFERVLFVGSNYTSSIPRTDFARWGHNYDAFLTNLLAIYQTTAASANDPAPLNQKVYREAYAPALAGILKRAYPSAEIKLEGRQEEQMVIFIRDMDATVANQLLRILRGADNSNVANGMRAMGISEVILKGNTYQRSIPRQEFIQWCTNYEQYVSELRRITTQVSGGVETERKKEP